MTSLSVNADFIHGAVSVEQTATYLQPWRVPHERRELFLAPNDRLLKQMAHTAGIRLRFITDSSSLRLRVHPLQNVRQDLPFRKGPAFDLTLDGELIDSVCTREGDQEVAFDNLPRVEQPLELWLPQDAAVRLSSVEVEDGASFRAAPDPRPRWLTYGSSLTHCVRAYSPARTWPAVLARRHDLNLTCLGLGGECHLEPLVGMMIRDLPADYLSLELGVNCIRGSYNERTFGAAVMGLICIIREKHLETPMVVFSPMAYPQFETTPNEVGMTIGAMRETIADVVQRLQRAGDRHLRYVNGLDVFGFDLLARYSKDESHPNAEGILVQADQVDQHVLRPLLEM